MLATTQPFAIIAANPGMAADGFVACDGVQSVPVPSVGWAQATTNRPPFGAGPSGA